MRHEIVLLKPQNISSHSVNLGWRNSGVKSHVHGTILHVSVNIYYVYRGEKDTLLKWSFPAVVS